MPAIAKLFICIGSLTALLAVIIGAFGAHGLENMMTEDLMDTYKTSVEYHFYHALGLILIGILLIQLPDLSLLRIAGWMMFAGIIIFSGSLYILSITGIKWLGAITPIGGTAFIISWLLTFLAVYKHA